jgi:hypothetical protein
MESQGRLLLRFYDGDDGTGNLSFQANSNGFAGEGDAWVSTGELQDFADAIAKFPLSEQEPPKLSCGYYKSDGSGELVEEHFMLRVYPIDQVGHLGIQVSITSELMMNDRPESQHTVTLEITTDSETLLQFSKDLKALLAGRVEEVVLDGGI